MTATDELLPCPFCGNAATYFESRAGVIGEFYQYCPNCGAQGPTVYQHHRRYEACVEFARNAWNRRASHERD